MNPANDLILFVSIMGFVSLIFGLTGFLAVFALFAVMLIKEW